MTRRCFS